MLRNRALQIDIYLPIYLLIAPHTRSRLLLKPARDIREYLQILQISSSLKVTTLWRCLLSVP